MGTLEAAVVNPLRSLSPGAVTLNRLPAGKGGPPGPLQVMPAEFSPFPSSSPLLVGRALLPGSSLAEVALWWHWGWWPWNAPFLPKSPRLGRKEGEKEPEQV